MLWALLALYFFGSSGASDRAVFIERTKTFVKEHIQDSTRRTDLLAVVEGAERTTKEQVQARGKVVKELMNISEHHAAKADDIQPVLERYHAEIAAYQERMIQYRFALKGKMSREEWAKVFPAVEPARAPK